jgi:FixJ family two-component response regulator
MMSKAHAAPGLPQSGLVGVKGCDCLRRLTLHRQWTRFSRLAGRNMEPIVAVVDDDESIRASLPHLLRQFGLAARAFASAQEYLGYDYIADTRCLILDIAMPGMSGPELQRELIRRGYAIPTIFITARSMDSIPPELFQQGAVKCLFKPFSGAELRAALDAALPNT